MPNMTTIKTVCVYCGSGPGTNPRFVETAIAFGKTLAEDGIRLVYGGGSVGLMGAVAKSVLDHGGAVTGIIPEFLTARENALKRVQELIVTPDMHERKEAMFARADGFAVLPGGPGTLDETFEILTWRQLGLHDKPIVIVDLDGYWRPLFALVDNLIRRGYARASFRDFFTVVKLVEDVLPTLARLPRARRPTRLDRL